jgi:hypothetical protein
MVTTDELQDMATQQLKIWQHDIFSGVEQMDYAATQTGAVTIDLCDAVLDTGIQSLSTARMNYYNALFNPMYGRLLVKLRLSSSSDVFAFWGFKQTLAAPTWGMTESHAGFMFYNGALYFSTGDSGTPSAHGQVTPITDCDVTRWLVYEIESNAGRFYSLPYTVPYFDKNVLPGLKQGLIRKWSPAYLNGSAVPQDSAHYFMFYVANTTGAAQVMELQFIDYAEVYPD